MITKETCPYSYKLKNAFNGKIVDTTHSKTQILNKFIQVAVKKELENNFNNTISKDMYFAIVYDLIYNVLFDNHG